MLNGVGGGKRLTPNRRRTTVVVLRKRFGVSERRACRVVGKHRSTQQLLPPVAGGQEWRLREVLIASSIGASAVGVAVCLEGRTAKRGGSSTTNICGACGAQEGLGVPRRRRKKRLTGALTQVGSFCLGPRGGEFARPPRGPGERARSWAGRICPVRAHPAPSGINTTCPDGRVTDTGCTPLWGASASHGRDSHVLANAGVVFVPRGATRDCVTKGPVVHCWTGTACTVPPVSQPPVIGIACSVLRAQWGPWDQPAAVVGADYILQVQRAGAVAVVIPPDSAHPGAVLDRIDALMLTGGADLEACAYGQEPHAAAEDPDRLRDAYEMALLREALARDMPLLGICRGMQILNVVLGGDLTQHLPEHVGANTHRRTTGSFEGNEHLVTLTPGSLAARAAGEATHRVPSHHHQAIDRLGDGLVVSGVAQEDGVVEAIEVPGRRFVLGVQWHPEADPSSSVIAALVDAALER